MSNVASPSCSYSSRHPYGPNENYVSSVFSLPGVTRYTIQIVNTTLEPGHFDNLYIMAGSTDVILYQYAPTVYFRGPQFIITEVTSTTGIRVKFRSDDVDQHYGYEIRVSPASQASSRSARTSKVSIEVLNVPRKTIVCDKYFISNTGMAVNTIAPGGSSSVVKYDSVEQGNSNECNDNPDPAVSSSSSKPKSLRARDSEALASEPSSSLSLQEDSDENRTLAFDVEYSGISKEEFESQFKLALERGELESVLRYNLEESGNPAYLAFTGKLSVASLSIETDESQVIGGGGGGGDGGGSGGDGGSGDGGSRGGNDDINDDDDSPSSSAFSLRSSASGSHLYPLVITVVMLVTTCFC